MSRRYNYDDRDVVETRIEREGRLWAIVALIALTAGGVAGIVWWLESRFGATLALVVVLGIVGAALLVAGLVINQAQTAITLRTAARFNDALASTEAQRAGVYREQIRADREVFNHRARAELVDQQRVQRLAEQMAKPMIEIERRRLTEQPSGWQAEQSGSDWKLEEWE